MRMQSSEASCGAAALANGLDALGISRTQEEMEALARTTARDGTGSRAMLRALERVRGEDDSPEANTYGTAPFRITESRREIAALKLTGALYAGRPVAMCVDDWRHWVVAIGILGLANPRVLVCDAAALHLVTGVDVDAVLRRWGRTGARKPYEGIVF